MEATMQCPVCTLFLREGMSLDAHLDTHPKDQVIRALCALSVSRRPPSANSTQSTHPSDSRSPFRVISESPRSVASVQSVQSLASVASYQRPVELAGFASEFAAPNEPVYEAAPRLRFAPPQTQDPYAPGSAFRSVVLLKPYPPRIPYPPGPPQRTFVVRQAERRPDGIKILSDIKLENPTFLGDPAAPAVRFDPPHAADESSSRPDAFSATESPAPPDDEAEAYADAEPDAFAEDAAETPADDAAANAFSVIKNVGNPNPFKDSRAPSPETPDGPAADAEATADCAPDTPPPSSSSPPKIKCEPVKKSMFFKKRAKALSIRRIRTKCARAPSEGAAPARPFPTDGGAFGARSDRTEDDGEPAGPDSAPAVPDPTADAEAPQIRRAPKLEAVRPEEDEDDFSGPSDAERRPADSDGVRPVNVIAYGTMNDDRSDGATAGSSSVEDAPIALTKTVDDGPFVSGDSSSAGFAAPGRSSPCGSFEGNVAGDVKHKVEIVEAADQEKTEKKKDSQYVWNQPTEKEEFTFTNFMQCTYAQNLYQKTEESLDLSLNDKKYTELICPQYTEPMKNGSDTKLAIEDDALNIRTDERMPPRGELSEQESSGDMDAPWAGMYRDIGGSTSYGIIAREPWISDGSDIDMPASPPKQILNDIEGEDMPIVVSVKPPDKNYKCATCGKAFNCPKERRVHRTTEHSAAISSNVADDKKVGKKQVFIKTSIKIKKEKTVSIETNIPNLIPKTNFVEIHNVSTGFDLTKLNMDLPPADISKIPELMDTEFKLEIARDEMKRRRQDYSCIMCKMEFPNEAQYNEHLKIHPLECLTCGKFFNRRANLHLHIKRHLGIKNFRCDICDKRFITKQKMVEHYNIHTNRSPVKCNLCDMTFRRHSNMVQHRNHFHYHIKKRLRDYVCSCGEVFHSKKKLAWHKEIHDDKPKACLHCNEKFIHMASLTRHMRRAHNNYFVPDEKRKNENVQCTVCANVYLKSSIEMHMKTHAGTKPYSCVICNKNFTTKWNLKLHTWTHANRSSKPFKCALCKGAFIRQTDYISHMNAHKSVRPYTCNHCGCQFIRKYNCQRHVKEHENEKRYVCEVPDCGKAFHRSYYLTEHMKVHSGVRPFSCNICGKTSSTKSNHNKHLKIHHAREPITTEG